MLFKASEIYRALKIIGDNKPFQREKFPPGMIYILRDYGIVDESSMGFTLTDCGSSLRSIYEEKTKFFGKKNVKFIPTMTREGTTYKVWVNPNAKPKIRKVKSKIEQETQLPETIPEISETFEENNEIYEQRKEHVTEFLSELEDKSKSIKGIEDKEGSKGEKLLIVTTIIDYRRTKKERELLDKIASTLKMKIESGIEPLERRYCFKTNDGKTPITLISRKDSKGGFGSYYPLEIEINLDEPVEESENFIETLVKKF